MIEWLNLCQFLSSRVCARLCFALVLVISPAGAMADIQKLMNQEKVDVSEKGNWTVEMGYMQPQAQCKQTAIYS